MKMNTIKLFHCLMAATLLFSCKQKTSNNSTHPLPAPPKPAPTIHIRPLGDIEDKYVLLVKKSIESFYHYPCRIEPKAPLTKNLLAISKTRYDAPKILAAFNDHNYKIIITRQDIAHRKDDDPEYGILGLGYRPGTTCVISTFRMRGNVSEEKFIERLEKVALHEIGHNLGLQHCTANAQCLMNDAKGSIRQVDREQKEMCPSCLKKLPKHPKKKYI
jgi:archaemetzincin